MGQGTLWEALRGSQADSEGLFWGHVVKYKIGKSISFFAFSGLGTFRENNRSTLGAFLGSRASQETIWRPCVAPRGHLEVLWASRAVPWASQGQVWGVPRDPMGSLESRATSIIETEAPGTVRGVFCPLTISKIMYLRS